jgi:hypothetical protein
MIHHVVYIQYELNVYFFKFNYCRVKIYVWSDIYIDRVNNYISQQKNK